MNYKIIEYTELAELLDKLNILPGNQFCFLPENLNETVKSEDFIYSVTTTDLNKVLKKESRGISYLTNDKPLLRSRKSSDWFGPTILIGFSVLSENPQLIEISISLISSYLYDLFKGSGGNKKVKFDIVIGNENNKSFKKISYEGDIDGVKELNSIIKNLKK